MVAMTLCCLLSAVIVPVMSVDNEDDKEGQNVDTAMHKLGADDEVTEYTDAAVHNDSGEMFLSKNSCVSSKMTRTFNSHHLMPYNFLALLILRDSWLLSMIHLQPS